jgi:hypothetical protein
MSGTPHPKSSSSSRRAGLEAELAGVVRFLADEELNLLVTIAARLWSGQTRYGPFDLARDRRNFRREALEEALDLGVYLAAVLHQNRQNGRCKHRRQSVERRAHGRSGCHRRTRALPHRRT